MKNKDITLLNHGLQVLINLKLYGQLKFKILKIVREVDAELEVLIKSLEGIDINSPEYKEIMEAESNFVPSQKLTLEELEPLEISAVDLMRLQPIWEENHDI